MLSIIATAGLPILVVMLALGGIAKVSTSGAEATPGGLVRLGPAVLVPERFTKPAMIFCGCAEIVQAVALTTVDHPVARWLPVAFFTVATYVLMDLRRRRPDVGCGCFGDVSATPVGLRAILRAAALAGMAVLVALTEVTGADVPAAWSWPLACWIGGGAVLILALSPELEESVARLRHRAPCEMRRLPPERALSRLRSSTAYRTYGGLLESDEPDDTWRELCWRFFVFPARGGADVVFAVYLSGRRPPVRAAVVSQDGTRLTSMRESTPVSA
ncbi:hypothetical protein JOL79_31820 [Microbispora sp. RL4-1S]|uniref:Methylamine utilisation protein MauE domain-containing protein n=1 Tax=Microbispora oryzae TaxID=2806554 RepID=A0A940WR19_9ACTN|nr:MauE/DoxX family redox-associated membrane protein [Microbispora oryzae]MBP2708377.1 hypothetical protein [Microbispora oryzae]